MKTGMRLENHLLKKIQISILNIDDKYEHENLKPNV